MKHVIELVIILLVLVAFIVTLRFRRNVNRDVDRQIADH
jgi:hypothetical protein